MFRPIAAFELRYQLRSPVFWVGVLLFFLLAFGATTVDTIHTGRACRETRRPTRAHRPRASSGARQVALVVAANLAINLAFFITHPIVTQYYTVPIAMLSLWTLLFATLAAPVAVAENPAPAQPAKA